MSGGKSAAIRKLQIVGSGADGSHGILVGRAADHFVGEGLSFGGGFDWSILAVSNRGGVIRRSHFGHGGKANCIELNNCRGWKVLDNRIYSGADRRHRAGGGNAIEVYTTVAGKRETGAHRISGNRISRVRAGIALIADGSSVTADNVIEDVDAYGISLDHADLTRTVGSEGIQVTGNTLRKIGSVGASAAIQTSALSRRLTFHRNTIGDVSGYGIANYSAETKIFENRVSRCGQSGIYSQASGVSIIGNFSMNNGRRSIENIGDGCTIENNQVGDDRNPKRQDFSILSRGRNVVRRNRGGASRAGFVSDLPK